MLHISLNIVIPQGNTVSLQPGDAPQKHLLLVCIIDKAVTWTEHHVRAVLTDSHHCSQHVLAWQYIPQQYNDAWGGN